MIMIPQLVDVCMFLECQNGQLFIFWVAEASKRQEMGSSSQNMVEETQGHDFSPPISEDLTFLARLIDFRPISSRYVEQMGLSRRPTQMPIHKSLRSGSSRPEWDDGFWIGLPSWFCKLLMDCWGPGSTDLQKEGVPLHQHQSDAPSYASCGWRTVEDTYARALNTRLLAVSQWASFSLHKAQNERIFIKNMFYDDQLATCPQLSPNGTYLLGRQQRFLTGCPAEVSH